MQALSQLQSRVTTLDTERQQQQATITQQGESLQQAASQAQELQQIAQRLAEGLTTRKELQGELQQLKQAAQSYQKNVAHLQHLANEQRGMLQRMSKQLAAELQARTAAEQKVRVAGMCSRAML